MPGRRQIVVNGDDVTAEFLNGLAANTELEQLTIWGGPLTNSDLEPVSRLTALKGLCLGEMRIDDGSLRHFQSLVNLEYLNLAYTAIRGDFGIIAALPLRDVRLEGCRLVSDDCARSLAGFSTLRQLEIHMTGLTDAGVEYLAGLPLEVLWLGPRITDRALETIGKIHSMKHLDLCSHMVSDEGVDSLSGLRNLEVLWLSRCSVTDRCIGALSCLRSLRELNVGSTAISLSGIAQIRAALPDCRLVETE